MECDEDDSSFSDGKPSQICIEARSVYIQLKSLVDSLKIGHDDDSGGTKLITEKSIEKKVLIYLTPYLIRPGLNSDISLDLESMDNTMSSSSRTEGVNHTEAIEFRAGMLSAMSDELTRLLLNLDAGNFRKMLDQTRNLVLEQEDEIKRSHQLIQQLESKVSI